jgi:hypothetical protein
LLIANGQWNESLIRELFYIVDDAIMRIPVRRQDDDLWAWKPEKHGVYSVRSAYRLLNAMRTQADYENAASGS